jgi:3-oxoacyl-[acyl-carrier-protein] synthase II
MGALTPVGHTVRDFWRSLLRGSSGAAPITKFDASFFKTKIACELKNFYAEDFFDRKEIRRIDPFNQYALVAVEEAMRDAQVDVRKMDRDRCGVIWASGFGGLHTFETEVKAFANQNGHPRFNPFFIPRILLDNPSGSISMKYGLKGVNYCPVSACASATTALIDSLNYIRWGKADLIVSGGSEAAITEAGIGGFGALKALSTLNDHPEIASRPFDKDRDGFVMGEGAGALILEDYGHAERRGAPIHAELIGGGMSADAYHMTATHPEGLGALAGMRSALEDCAISPREIDYINAHATSTPKGDISELKAIRRLSDFNGKGPYIGATKSMTGHLLGAAGAIEAIICVLAVNKDIMPPTINIDNLDPETPAGLNIVLGAPVQSEIHYALSNTFGFGGHNASVIVRKHDR